MDEPGFVGVQAALGERAAVFGDAAGEVARGRAQKREAEGEPRIVVLAVGGERARPLERAAGGGEVAGVEERAPEARGGLEAGRAEPRRLGQGRDRLRGAGPFEAARAIEEAGARQPVRVRHVVPQRRRRRIGAPERRDQQQRECRPADHGRSERR